MIDSRLVKWRIRRAAAVTERVPPVQEDGVDEQALLEAMTALADAVVHMNGRDTYELLDYAYGKFLDYDARRAGSAYQLWAEVTDIAEIGPASMELSDRVALMVADDWLAIDASSAQAVDEFFERWACPWERGGVE